MSAPASWEATIDRSEPLFRRWGIDVIRLRLQVLRLLPIADRWIVVLLAVAALAWGLLPLLFTVSVGALIGLIPDVVRDGFGSDAGTALIWTLTGTTVVFAALQVIEPARQALEGIARRQIDESLRAKTLDDLSRPPGIAHLEDPDLLDHLGLIRDGALELESSPGGAAVLTVRLIGIYVQGLGGAVLVGAFFSWWSAAILLAACLLCRRLLRRGLLEYLWIWRAPRQMRLQRRASYDQWLGVDPPNAKEARVFGLRDWLIERFWKDWDECLREPEEIHRRLFRNIGVAYGVLGLAYAFVFVRMANASAEGALELGALALVVQASFDISHLSRGGPWDYDLELGTVVLPKIREIEAHADRATAEAGRTTPAPDVPRDAVRFERVAFRYSGGDHDVLRELDLEIPARRSLAVVGPNGAGKTTIVKLLAGLYEPTDGRIVVDGTDLREIDPTEWQRRIAVIFQDFVRYELPARENVGFGSVASLGDQEALVRAATRSGALEMIEELPHGWDTVLSRQYTRGADLSGGEWQRVALARCHLAIEAGARILVLDEPTASLDVREEARFFDEFVELTRGLTTILISHRFSTVRAASRIVVIDDGGIVEDGSHDELVGRGGTYAEMFRMQAGHYSDDRDGS